MSIFPSFPIYLVKVSSGSFVHKFFKSNFDCLHMPFFLPPQWFYDIDNILDSVSVLVLLLIAFFSMSYYRISKRKNYLLLTASFSILALSFAIKVAYNFIIYHNLLSPLSLLEAHEFLESLPTFIVLAVFLHRFLHLVGLFLLYLLHQKVPKSSMFLLIYFAAVLTYFSRSAYYLFHLTTLFLLLFITWTYVGQWRLNKRSTTLLLTIGFATMALSQVLFMFYQITNLFYVAAEIIQVVAYLVLLITFILVLRHGKTK